MQISEPPEERTGTGFRATVGLLPHLLEKAFVFAEKSRDARFAVLRLGQVPLCLRVEFRDAIRRH